MIWELEFPQAAKMVPCLRIISIFGPDSMQVECNINILSHYLPFFAYQHRTHFVRPT
jgi:hypothetical protein